MREEYGIDVTKSTTKTERTVIDTGTGKSRKGYWRSDWRYAHLAPEHLRTAVSRLEGLTSIEPTKVWRKSWRKSLSRPRGRRRSSCGCWLPGD